MLLWRRAPCWACACFDKDGGQIGWTEGREKWYHEEIAKFQNYCQLFILYVSFFFCFIPSLPIVSAVRRPDLPANQRVSSTPQASLHSPHCQIHLWCPPRWQVRVHDDIGLNFDHWSDVRYIFFNHSQFSDDIHGRLANGVTTTVLVYPRIPHPIPLFADSWKAQNHSILLCPHCHPSSTTPWCSPRREPRPQRPARPWERGRAHRPRGMELVQRRRR